MSALEALRQEIDQEEAEVKPVVEPVVENEVEEVEELEAAEPTELDEVDEIELSLDDEPKKAKPTPEEALVFKLTKEKKKRKEADSELEKLKAENEALKAGRQPTPQPQSASPIDRYAHLPQPVMGSDGIHTTEEYRAAYTKWEMDRRAVDQQYDQQARAKVDNEQQTHAKAMKLSERSVEFIKTNRIKAELATQAIQDGVHGLDEAMGVEGAGLDMLDIVGEGSDKLAYYLGKNPEALDTVRDLMKADPRGFRVQNWLSSTAIKLNKTKRNISNAPEPDEPLTGDGSSASGDALQAQYDKETDYNKLVVIRNKARSMGVTLKT